MKPADWAELKVLAQVLLSTRERHFSQCAGKFAFDSRKDANKALRREDCEVYRCKCGKWHIGSQTQKRIGDKARKRLLHNQKERVASCPRDRVTGQA